MRNLRTLSIQRLFFFFLLIASVIFLFIQLILYSRSRTTFPSQMVIAGIPVGGLNRAQAAERLLEIYSIPVELHYEGSVIYLHPGTIGYSINLDSMLAAANLQSAGTSFWVGFWEYLWGIRNAGNEIPLDASYSEETLVTYLEQEIGQRYDNPPAPARPIPGSLVFTPGSPGTTINLGRAVVDIENALNRPGVRIVNLPIQQVSSARPSLANLQVLLQQTIDLTNFDGLAGVYLLDLQTAQELHFLYQNGENLFTDPDVSFTAASIIKIPIMVSAYRRLGSDISPEAERFMLEMITLSGNDPADWLMEQYIDPFRGPLDVTEDMQALGLENTFLAGHFRLGSPLLFRYTTPANSREDISTDPDPYNQTTLSDMGMLLADIYQCSENGGSALLAVFPNEITQDECRTMVDLLADNLLPDLLTAGLPEGTRIAHKHGWHSDFTGAIFTIGDAGIIFGPTGDYVLVIFFSHPVQLAWEPISDLIADLSAAIYNYYNTPIR
ncbi:MAG: class A beta-lactamase-related serine hydrolase [Anaerolineae bacterium]|nr:class A beta-lactamase-related serine hydrolase [Anaerolineae bacterium]